MSIFTWKSIAKDGPPKVKIGETWHGMAANANRSEVFHDVSYHIASWNMETRTYTYVWQCEYGLVPDDYFTHWAEYPKAPKREG